MSSNGLSTAVANDRLEGTFGELFEFRLFFGGDPQMGCIAAVEENLCCSPRGLQCAGQSHGRYNCLKEILFPMVSSRVLRLAALTSIFRVQDTGYLDTKAE
jgi:hypothetical protein